MEPEPNTKKERLVARLASLGVLAVYGISLVLPATYFSGNEPQYTGFQYLSCGWMGPCNQPNGLFGWYGNPLFLFGLIALAVRRGWIASVFGILGFAVALQSLAVEGGLAPNEGGVTTLHFVGWGAGFYVWLASYLLLFSAGVSFEIWRRLKGRPEPR